MKKFMAIIPAAVLSIGAAAMGVMASAAPAEKPNISVDYSAAFSKNNARTAEETRAVTVTSQANSRGNFVDEDNDGICDNYANGACPRNGAGYGCRRKGCGRNRA